MKYITGFASGFMNLFQTGGKTFITWMSTIIPVVLLLLVLMNTIISFLGEERMEKLAKASSRNPITRYMILPFLAAFMLGNPMSFSLGRFMPEFYKPSYYAALAQFNHTSNGVFPHINPGELFIWLGIAQGVQKLGLNTMDLAVRYLLVGLVMNFIGGWVTDFTTAYVCKTSGVILSKEVKLSVKEQGETDAA
ncbi:MULTISPECIES: PTS glucitol/sorbitol transporter subunit IIC [Loigolactobacillus]|uniref:PTS glucitol/sorbitol transporter subunit IIC n=1 Tax=Loigolactobacillus backii TaxID=375175 RepID=A0A192H0T6_9LACO|nr:MULTISPECIES: PTS glucitol/sorbitol transporter subunit IIC [Loigolactobacillus]ANK60539.1 PTS glucitol/sorbitol transporter subunit IIC [Loigolactobacillus backii]ANK61893.1 PTS glucitol/sorbitol transporter subunit IIC [Loigolactobacillus backii]ANK65490.1 PTS glucitol/sorbitol transporter subunit IIC [Loigolactobacillus backii]ANK67964.1 PTS glucitol/sorbitol transporter subunit IIC [Loigolactobacillus backii]ANK68913.1 PTS glucitol/sorbitol transporter subunit IIC [Loigolactobacillus ba